MWRNWWIGHSVWSACRGVLDQQERKHAKHSITKILGMIEQILEELHWHCNFFSNFSRLFLPESFFQFFLEFASPSSSVSWGTALMRLSWSSVASLSCAPRSRPLRSGHTSWPVFHYIKKSGATRVLKVLFWFYHFFGTPVATILTWFHSLMAGGGSRAWGAFGWAGSETFRSFQTCRRMWTAAFKRRTWLDALYGLVNFQFQSLISFSSPTFPFRFKGCSIHLTVFSFTIYFTTFQSSRSS